MFRKELNHFLSDGWVDFGNVLDKKKCKFISQKVLKSRPWNESLFRSYNDVFNNERHLNVSPQKNKNNLAEKYNLNFIENNFKIQTVLENILGSGYDIILKKFVVSVPETIIPKWLRPIVEKKLDGNLAQYIKPEYRDISYFSGIDYHMDLLDYSDFYGDYITLYVYLTDVNNDQSPLNVIDKSHEFGATHFPHFLKKNKDKIKYSFNGKNYKTFDNNVLLSKAGRAYLWSALTLHGTKKSLKNKPRIALRYSIKRSKNKKKIFLIDKVYNGLKIRLNNKTRVDIKINKNNLIKRRKLRRFLT